MENPTHGDVIMAIAVTQTFYCAGEKSWTRRAYEQLIDRVGTPESRDCIAELARVFEQCYIANRDAINSEEDWDMAWLPNTLERICRVFGGDLFNGYMPNVKDLEFYSDPDSVPAWFITDIDYEHDELESRYNDGHPYFTKAMWIAHVNDGQTEEGYWRWVVGGIENMEMADLERIYREKKSGKGFTDGVEVAANTSTLTLTGTLTPSGALTVNGIPAREIPLQVVAYGLPFKFKEVVVDCEGGLGETRSFNHLATGGGLANEISDWFAEHDPAFRPDFDEDSPLSFEILFDRIPEA